AVGVVAGSPGHFNRGAAGLLHVNHLDGGGAGFRPVDAEGGVRGVVRVEEGGAVEGIDAAVVVHRPRMVDEVGPAEDAEGDAVVRGDGEGVVTGFLDGELVAGDGDEVVVVYRGI